MALLTPLVQGTRTPRDPIVAFRQGIFILLLFLLLRLSPGYAETLIELIYGGLIFDQFLVFYRLWPYYALRFLA